MRKMFVIAALASAACVGGSGDSKQDTTPTAATPVFSAAAGTYDAPLSVVISTSTAGAAIHYTTDGSTPTAASTAYTGAVALSTATTLKAIATASGYLPSAVASAAYAFQVATPTFSPAGGTYATAQSVSLVSATPGASIFYTTDGSTPTSASTAYTAPIELGVGGAAATTVIRAVATRAGFADSAGASASYTMDPGATPAATPTFTPGAGTYTAVQDVTIACATAGATIYFTTDGSEPTAGSTVYTTPVAVTASKTLKAIATAAGHTTSAVGSAAYVINLPTPAATPTFSPVPGTYSSAQSVTIGSTTPGAVIHCTTDGSPATAGSPTCSAPVAVPATTTIRAVATATGYGTSAEATGTYTISGGGGSVDIPTLCSEMTTALRSLFATCYKMNPALLGSMSSDCAALAKEIGAGRLSYDPVEGGNCVTGVQALTCAAIGSSGGIAMPAACTTAFTPHVANGSLCYMSESCAAGYCTSEHTASCPGTCQPFATAGQDCATKSCAAGLVCATTDGTHYQCKTPSGLDGPCPCQDAYWCDASGGAPGVCRAQKTSGTCSTGPGANPAECDVGYACFSGNCTALVGGGASCTANPCGYGWNCQSGVCTSFPTTGQACSITLPCAGAWCDYAASSPTCQAYRALGDPCSYDGQCASLSCTGGHCDLGFCAAP